MIVMAPFLVLSDKTKRSFKKMYQAQVSIAMRTHQDGLPVTNPRVISARFDTNYVIAELTTPWRNARGGISGHEAETTADSRLLWKEAQTTQRDMPSIKNIGSARSFLF